MHLGILRKTTQLFPYYPMNITYIFTLEDHVDADQAWQELESLDWQPLYATEDDQGCQQIVVQARDPLPCPSLSLFHYPGVSSIQPFDLPPIDWEAQWSSNSQYYRDGLLHCDLSLFGPAGHEPLLLEPGPGFGDLSHPTTRLVLRMMALHVQGNIVIDIGCGSGILSLAAARWGGSQVWAIDISSEAITHAQANAERNGLQETIAFIDSSDGENCLPKLEKTDQVVVVMNMIASEQQDALAGLPLLLSQAGVHWITSGILAEQQDDYLEACAGRGWLVQEIVEEDGWLGMHFVSQF